MVLKTVAEAIFALGPQTGLGEVFGSSGMWDFGFHLFGVEIDVRVCVGDGDLESFRGHLEDGQVWTCVRF